MSDEIYQIENVPVFEALYGSGLISLGGYEAVEQMFTGLDLNQKKLLDVGSGIGGMAHFLAAQYHCQVTGLEVHAWMAEYATSHAPNKINNQVNFVTYQPNGSIPLPSGSFDVIYSKGVLTNVQDKQTLFSKLYDLLTPNGLICLVDWIVPESTGPKYERLSLGDMSYKETKASYQKILSNCGFKDIQIEDRSEEYLEYVKQMDTLLNSTEHKNQHAQIISPALREELILSNQNLLKTISEKQQMSVRIIAIKSE